MELMIIRAVLTVFCLYAGPALAKTTCEEFMQRNKKVTFEVIITAFWSICHFSMLPVLSTDNHRLFDDKTAIQIVLVMYTVMLVMYLLQLVLTTIKRFRTKEYIRGTGMVIVCAFYAMFTVLPLIVLHVFF